MGEVRTLLVDCDGVLTNGQVHVTSKGKRSKSFNSRDNRALSEFVAAGWRVHVVSASGWPALADYVKNTGVEVHIDCLKTPEDIHRITQGEPYVAVGDDVYDLDMLGGASQAFCPADADQEIYWRTHIAALDTEGGRGVVAELARILLRENK